MADEEESEVMSHPELMELFRQELTKLMKDPLLKDLPSEPKVEEVNAQLALEHGRAIVVNVRQQDEKATILPVVIVQNATVDDLKKAIKRHITLKQERDKDTSTQISWNYVWRTYWLTFHGQKLTEDHKQLKEYGISNKDEVTFTKKLRRK
ncbi:U11/U12 small nuclear ribonucleoprotein 25 kDa protein isoform X4 [Exaiptasia diaphana]|uniref:SNRNP25 ubiquitin-like domain-containing protein n=1 Tax=Exaiptasia diaphana TaxID=2652724 RepID=A0A913WX52_EXADI|nr:U11/U12 small nuclear ribonucleoprotein 25 kDa protein isoform X4 [Exaiptasia diaphana]KXJ27715.1 U11/U12 small nuclear ribonucleoprotein 25 kDa protein [Exaiptasia diaphana]